jgi:ATP-binding cassette subfamily B protein
VGALYEHDLYLSNLYRFLDDDAASDPASAPAEPRARLSAPRERGAVVRFEDVGFRYAGTDTWALRHVDVELARGQSVALVGQNGAGKSTFVKLLLRLYEPTEGRILLDGRDLREWDREDLFKRVAAVFQDFNRYKLSYRENVAFGSLPDAADDARVARATERSGASELLSGLSRGEGTVLGRWFRDGVELSGGQWQKVALARAFMREEADVLVLDEPSAALDAEAEHALFQRIQALSDGKTTILISHRFSTVRSADRILVFEGGRVLEDGTHDALVALGGTYARLYAIQAEGYR